MRLSIPGRIRLAFSSLLKMIVVALPDDFARVRSAYYRRRGVMIEGRVSISPNVMLRGKIAIGDGSSIAQNCSISGMTAGVVIGRDVMIAPNVVIVAFDHQHVSRDLPMAKQGLVERPVVIEDDVWIAANATIGKGVTIGRGAIIGANSFVNRDVAPYSIVAGVPAVAIGGR